MELGKLEKIEEIRVIWPDEARNFTNWLAEATNLSQLAEAIGYGQDGIELVKKEENVGSFFADIVARDTLGGEGGLVLIENQFGKTNHDHLGKLITYSAGLPGVRTIVWISESFREEHRAALDWLNRISGPEIGFFGIEIELWKIGSSLPAPRFSVISRPNDWARSGTDPVSDSELSDLRKLYVRYWAALGEHIRKRKSSLKPQKALPQQWTNFSIGRAGFSLAASAADQSGAIRAELALTGVTGKAAFDRLLERKEEADNAYGTGLTWDRMEGRKQARISETLPGVDIWNENDWARQHDWLAGRLDRLYQVFHARVLSLNLDGFKLGGDIGAGVSPK